MLGYCVFPLAVAAILVKISALAGLKKGLVATIVDFIIVTLAFVWSMFGRFIFDLHLVGISTLKISNLPNILKCFLLTVSSFQRRFVF